MDYTYDGRARPGCVHKVYYTLVDCNPLTLLLRFILDLSYKLFLHCCAAVGKILTDISRRAVRKKKNLADLLPIRIQTARRDKTRQFRLPSTEVYIGHSCISCVIVLRQYRICDVWAYKIGLRQLYGMAACPTLITLAAKL